MAEDKKTHRFKISDESLNTYGTWVQSKGVDLKAYKGNPVVLLGHRRMSDWESRNAKPERIQVKPKVAARGFACPLRQFAVLSKASTDVASGR